MLVAALRNAPACGRVEHSVWTSSEHPEPEIVDDVSAFKLAFRRLAAGVSVVTGRTPDGRPVGFTATSLASLAAVPPLATFNMARISSAWPADRADRSRRSSTSWARATVTWPTPCPATTTTASTATTGLPGPLNLPLLNDVPAWMLGRIVGRYPVVNNAVIVVQIEDGGLGEHDDAMLYHERDYLRPGDRA